MASSSPTELSVETQVLVIGAGPYGVGIAQALFEQGIGFVIVGQPFELWQNHTLNSMLLRSDLNASEIYSRDGRYQMTRFLATRGGKASHRMPVAVFRSYLDWVLEELPFEVLKTRVMELETSGQGFQATLANGDSINARFAVVATGLGGHQHWPTALGNVDRDLILHSWDTKAIEALERQRVLLIGGGQSAAESVEALRRGRNRVTWVLRRPPTFFSEPLRLPTPLFKLVLLGSAFLYRLPQPILRLLSSLIFRTTITPHLRPVFAEKAVRKVFADAAELGLERDGAGVKSNHTEESYDCVVAATGYHFSLEGLPFLGPKLRHRLGVAHTVPPLDRSFRTPVPELFLAGGIAEATFGPAQRFIMGSWPAARHISRALSLATGN